jgi:hypothetical protein
MVVCELKAVDQMSPLFLAQLMTYMKLADKRLGFLINFNVPLIKHGLKRSSADTSKASAPALVPLCLRGNMRSMLTPTTQLLLALAAALLPLIAVAAWLWRRFYREDPANTARRVLKNSAVPFAARLVVRALDLVFAVILLSTLSGPEVGLYYFAALVVVQYFGTIAEFGLGVLLTRDVARDPAAARRLFGVTLALRWLLALAAAPAAALLVGGYALLAALGAGEAISPVGQQVIWVLLLTLIPSAYSGAVTALYNAAERMEVPAVVELGTAVLSLFARVAVLLLGFGILGLAWAAVAVSTATRANRLSTAVASSTTAGTSMRSAAL